MTAQAVLQAKATRSGFTLDVNVAWPLSGCTVLFGPSGAGKSTLLRILAGVEAADSAHLAFGEETLSHVPPEARRVAWVPQDGALFPHLSVAENLGFAVPGGPAWHESVTAMMARLGLSESLRKRRPAALSGGERQRVALGRALLSGARLLALDEPFAALDARRRAALAGQIRSLVESEPVPVLLVSHAVDDLVALGDSVILLDQGRVIASGSPTEAAVMETLNELLPMESRGSIVTGTVQPDAHGGVLLAVSAQLALHLPPLANSASAMRVLVRARDVILARTPPQETSLSNALPGRVRNVQPQPDGSRMVTVVLADDSVLRAAVTEAGLARLGLGEGDAVWALVKALALTGGVS